MTAARRVPLGTAAPASCPTAEMALAYLRQPNATRAQLFLRAIPSPGRDCRHGPHNAPALPTRHLRALDRAPRLSSSDSHLPALGRWHGSQLARERRLRGAATGRIEARQRGPRPGRAAPAMSPASPRPATLTVEVSAPGSDVPWRGRYHLVVIDGEVLLLPRRVDDPNFRFRAYAGREFAEGDPTAPGARAIDAALRALAAALQAHLDARDAEREE
jgi:hypothetical protein